MPRPATEDTTAIVELRAKLRIINAIYNFVVVILLGLVAGFLYKPVGQALSSLPPLSMKIILGLVIGLTIAVTYLSWLLSIHIVKSIKKYNSQLDRLLRDTRELKDEIHMDFLLDKIMDFSISMTGSSAGTVFLVDREELIFKAVGGSAASTLLGTRIPRDRGVAGWVAQQGEPLYINDVTGHPLFNPDVDATSGFTTRSLLCVPLVTTMGVIGVVELLNKREGQYNDRDMEMVDYLAEQAAVSLEKTEFFEKQRNYETHMTALIVDTIDFVLNEKKGHSQRVAQYAGILARAISMTEEELRTLHFASLLHDIGSLRVALMGKQDEIPYSEHNQYGQEFLQSIEFYRALAPIVRHQHERFDGEGGPDRLKGADIPIESRIIALAESFDMFLNRGEESTGLGDAFGGLRRHAGERLDPNLVELFIEQYKKEIPD